MRIWTMAAWAALVGVSLVAGCGGGGGGGGGSANTGLASVTLTDAPSDRLQAFEVGIASVELIHESGQLVPVLPASTRVDLTELVALSELVAAQAVPTGIYMGVVLGLDVSQARVVISGNGGPARLTDASGVNLSGVLRRGAFFAPGQRLTIGLNGHADVEVDLDLDLSCAVDPAANVVRFEPTLIGTPNPSAPAPIRLRGTLAAVDSNANTFALEPQATGAAATELPMRVTSNTRVLLDGVATNFLTLAQRPLGIGLLVQAEAHTSQAYTATMIEAWSASDVVTGVVTGRTAGGTFALRGATVERANGTRSVNQDVSLNATGAAVTRSGSTTALTLDEVAVGSRVIARGTFSGSTLNATGTGGHLVLLDSTIFGTATGAPSGGRLTLALDRIAGRPISEFTFTVDGAPSADPAAFLVDLAGQPASNVVATSPVAMRVRMAPYTAASTTPDATAQTVQDVRREASVLRIDWLAATPAPFEAQSSSQVTLDLVGSQQRLLDIGADAPGTLTTSAKPVVQPESSATTCFIVEDGAIVPFSSFSTWQGELAVRLGAGARARTVTAVGRWDGTNTLFARSVLVLLE